jgi:hypothetical protein
MFYLKEPKSKNKSLIIVKYYVVKDKKYFQLSTNIKINPKNWDKKTRSPIRKRGGGGIESLNIIDKLNEINKKINIFLPPFSALPWMTLRLRGGWLWSRDLTW